MGWGGWTMMVLFWLIAIGIVAWLVAALRRRDRGDSPLRGRKEDRAESVLRERFARGEIDEESYRRKLDELQRS